MKTLRQRGVRMALAALLIAGGGAGVAYATVAIATGSGDVIVGCAKNNNGQLRIVGDVSQCLPSEHPVAFQAPTPSSEPQSVLVDCAAGQSINAALASVPVSVPLTVNIQGTCTEAVNISRDEVTLQAVSAGDGIQAPSADAAALVLNGASHVNLGQLTLTGGRTGLAAFKGASFSAFNLHVSGAGTGVMVNASSSGNFNQPLIEHSVQDGLAVGSGGSAQFFGGTISNSGGDGVSLSGGHVELGNTDVTGSGFQGVAARDGGTAELNGTTIEHSAATGVHAFNGGSVNIGGGSVIQYNGQGGVIAHSGSVNLQGARVANNHGGGVGTFAGGRLNIQGGTIIENNSGDGVTSGGGGAVSLQGQNFVRNNGGSGVHVRDASVGIFDFPSGSNQIVDNGGWGIFCDGAPAVAMITGMPGTISGNPGGSNNCPNAS